MTTTQILFREGKNVQAWWYLSVIPAVRRQRQENYEFQDSLSCIARSCLKKTIKEEEEQQTEQPLPLQSEILRGRQRGGVAAPSFRLP
jgi:hypothetical protein